LNPPGVPLSKHYDFVNVMKPARARTRWLPLVLLFGVLPVALHYAFEPAACGENVQVQPDARVVMYSTSWCPYCAKARAYFKRCGISYFEYDIEASAQNLAQFRALNGHGVPLIMIGDKRMEGFNARSFESLLK
jgi:glutaredoxin